MSLGDYNPNSPEYGLRTHCGGVPYNVITPPKTPQPIESYEAVCQAVYAEALPELKGQWAKEQLANDAVKHGVKFMQTMPKYWMPSLGEDFMYKQCYAYIEERVTPKGFGALSLFALFFPFIKDFVINLIVRLLLKRFMSDTDE